MIQHCLRDHTLDSITSVVCQNGGIYVENILDAAHSHLDESESIPRKSNGTHTL